MSLPSSLATVDFSADGEVAVARMLHFKFQTSLAFTHSAFLKGQSSNEFNLIQIYSQNGTTLILNDKSQKNYR